MTQEMWRTAPGRAAAGRAGRAAHEPPPACRRHPRSFRWRVGRTFVYACVGALARDIRRKVSLRGGRLGPPKHCADETHTLPSRRDKKGPHASVIQAASALLQPRRPGALGAARWGGAARGCLVRRCRPEHGPVNRTLRRPQGGAPGQRE
ncbi:MAG: hypothetical protein J3K34DRAFT_416925 [Monoraphidium minutum]|nr:MAG: hypothetical protein J3K34DRAFT_416925 [Monoraphidium minutum]